MPLETGLTYKGGQLGKGLFTYHPFKFFWGLTAIFANLIQFPLWILMYLIPRMRPNPNWSLQTAVVNLIVSRDLWHRGAIQSVTPFPLSSRLEGKRWEIVYPSLKDVYKGVAKHETVQPAPIGGAWYPNPPTKGTGAKTTIIHFHGGAFVIGQPRDWYTLYTAKTLTKYVAPQVVMAGYRLSSNAGNQFPAQLQDAITWYQSVLDRGIPASSIVLSGDSAGGNLALQLLRYLESHRDIFPDAPAACLLFSPWIDMISAFHPEEILKSPRYPTDYIVTSFPNWGASTVAVGIDPLDPYLSPLRGPFYTATPLFIQVGTSELLYDDGLEFVDLYRKCEGKDGRKNVVELHLAEHCNHDIILIGHLMGFGKQVKETAEHASRFVEEALTKARSAKL